MKNKFHLHQKMLSRSKLPANRIRFLSRCIHSKKTLTSESELAHFNELASTWWDSNGSQRILHKMNLLRMDFINETINKNIKLNKKEVEDDEVYVPGYSLDLLPDVIKKQILKEQELKRQEVLKSQGKWKSLDIGCGGGLLTESLARLPQIESVKAIDLSENVLNVAKAHAALDPSIKDKITYELKAIEDIPKDEQFDIVTMMEMLEHVDSPNEVLLASLKHVKPGGWLFISTINRDLISWFTTIFMGEHVLKIVPLGTHTLSKYINESELQEWFETKPEFEVIESKGSLYLPFTGWIFSPTTQIGNYFMAIRRTK